MADIKTVKYQKVVITDSVDEINDMLKDGEFLIQSVIPIPITGSVGFEGDAATGQLGGSKLCFILGKI